MSNNPIVSVLIPAYNHEKYVQKTILSIINQKYSNIELLILDDGSKDKTFEKINEMKSECEKHFKRVVFLTQKNQGTCMTLNRLMDLTKGKYIYLIASDDISNPDAIQKEVEFLEKHQDYGLAVGDNEIIDLDGNSCFWDKKRNIEYDKNKAKYKTFVGFLKKSSPYFDDKNFGTYHTLFLGNYIPNGCLIRSDVWKKIQKCPAGEFLEDWFLMLQLSKYTKFKFINEVLFAYRWHQSNTIKNKDKILKYTRNTRKYELEVLKKIISTDSKNILPEVIDVFNNGVLYKKIGIPFFIEVLGYRYLDKKIKIVKLFNITICKIYKK